MVYRMHWILLAFMLVVVVGTVSATATRPEMANSQPLWVADVPAEVGGTAVNNCRYGVSPLGGADAVAKVGELGAGWYLTFGATKPAAPTGNDADFVGVIAVKEVKNAQGNYTGQWYVNNNPSLIGTLGETTVKNLVSALPNTLWIVGNEIDRVTQGELTPVTYAKAYYHIYHWIKEADPNAQVSISGLVQVTPLRLVYLDMIWDAYRDLYGVTMPVDVWNMHLYPLPELDEAGNPGAAHIPVGVDLTQTTAVPKRASGNNPALCADPNVYCVAEHDNMTVFQEQVVLMRQWMKANGQQNKPLIISEYSQLWLAVDTVGNGQIDFLRDEYGNVFSPQRVSTFMTNSFNYLNNAKDASLGYPLDENRLVQQWLWFSVYIRPMDLNNDGVPDYGNWEAQIAGQASDLYRPVNPPTNMTLAPTLMGSTFASRIAAEAARRNLVIESVTVTAVQAATLPTSVDISVTVRNSGNRDITTPFTITFTDTSTNTVIGTATVTETISGCAIWRHTATISWPGLSAGVHKFSVQLDTGNAIAETNESDNLGNGLVMINQQTLFVPVILR